MRSHHATTLIVLAATLAAYGCSTNSSSQPMGDAVPESMRPLTAVADLSPTAGNTVRGTVTFTREAGGVRIVADLAGLAPGEHGFEVLASGDCQALEVASAGDLGNLTADPAGNARVDRVDPNLLLDGEQSIIGRALVVRAGPATSSASPAAPRTACGVIVKIGE
jgi:Cu-Zn family superoxide dismutase